ncbi:Aste57867_10272 [Aphanomyces stellatus]|uniref:Aste57867_10272 protein n=1 Tax=Aphanomyces stellatus TaxID=120398 RepID=A0A485KQK8_9STRA|nr:hypothetical protein As57867_010232 [Aphanomyces stellatus]VFT87147.1 Aste57867_10272 [Aphanomyces stellatus]
MNLRHYAVFASIICICFLQPTSTATAVTVPKSPRKTTEVWVYEDASNPWNGKSVEKVDADEVLEAIQAFLDISTKQIHDGNVDLAALASMETQLYEHFYELVDLAKDQQSATKVANRIFELNASMQVLLNLLTAQRKVSVAGGGDDAASLEDPFGDPPMLSDEFLDIYDELVDHGYSASTFAKWKDMAASESSPGAALEVIASYMLFQPNPVDLPLDLPLALQYLQEAGTASALVLDAIVRLAVYRNETNDSVLRTYASMNFLARMVLAHRIYTNQTRALSGDACEEAAAYYYTSADESVQDMVDAGGEKDVFEPMLRLSDAWMGKFIGDDFLEVPSSGSEALHYVRSLAFGGHLDAVHRLGEMHFFGDPQAGLAPNPHEALRHFEQAAAGGLVHSLANLGLMYANGMGVEANPERAVQYFQQAADQGNAFAVNGLGFMFWTGQGVAKNATKAVEYFKKAAEMGHADAHQYLGAAYMDGDGVDRNASRAFYHYEIAANESNSRQAQFNLGIMYYNGMGTDRSCARALHMFRDVAWRAAFFDDAMLAPDLAYANYEKGDIPRALLHYLVWALVGLPEGAVNAGFLLEQQRVSLGETAPLALAKELYTMFPIDAEALRKLGHCHRDGWAHACDPANASTALAYYGLASAMDDSEALYSAGVLHAMRGEWDHARAAWTRCKAHEFPDNVPCLAPALAMEALAWIEYFGTWVDTLVEQVVTRV